MRNSIIFKKPVQNWLLIMPGWFALTALALILSLLIATMAYSRGFEITRGAGKYETRVRMSGNPPALGDNNIAIEIRDASGRHVKEAKENHDEHDK